MSIRVSDRNKWWMTGEVRYYNSLPKGSAQETGLLAAVDEVNKRTVMRMVLRQSGTTWSFLKFINSADGQESVVIGRPDGKGTILCNPAQSEAGYFLHLLGHGIGLYDEQNRADRDTYVSIKAENVEADKAWEFEQVGDLSEDLGSYDYGSIMHGSEYEASKNGEPTLRPTQEDAQIGQRKKLSQRDIAGIHQFLFDWSKTSAVQPEGQLVPTSSAAAAVEVDGALMIAFRAPDDATTWITTQTSDGYSKPEAVPGVVTKGTAALAQFGGKLYLVFRESSSNLLRYVTRDGTAWSAPTTVPNDTSSPNDPTVAVFRDKLWITYRKEDSSIEFIRLKSDGSWKPAVSLTAKTGAKTSTAPASGVANGRLFIVYRGKDSSNVWVSYKQDNSWQPQIQLSKASGVKTSLALGVAGLGNDLFIFCRGAGSDNLWACHLEGSEARPQVRVSSINGAKTDMPPAVTVHDGRVQVIVRDPATQGLELLSVARQPEIEV